MPHAQPYPVDKDPPPTVPLQPYQQRVHDEKETLDVKILKLDAFMKTETAANLHLMERNVMYRQLSAMQEYSDCLAERIRMFTMNTQEKGL